MYFCMCICIYVYVHVYLSFSLYSFYSWWGIVPLNVWFKASSSSLLDCHDLRATVAKLFLFGFVVCWVQKSVTSASDSSQNFTCSDSSHSLESRVSLIQSPNSFIIISAQEKEKQFCHSRVQSLTEDFNHLGLVIWGKCVGFILRGVGPWVEGSYE
jgi:hypothetical protein